MAGNGPVQANSLFPRAMCAIRPIHTSAIASVVVTMARVLMPAETHLTIGGLCALMNRGGTLGKTNTEALENIDDRQREGVRSVGAGPAAVQRYGVVPQVLPVFLSQALYFWEANIRGATVIGAVGAGGIGLKLIEAMRTNQDWENVAYMVVLILIVVFIFDNISNAIRQRLIGPVR